MANYALPVKSAKVTVHEQPKSKTGIFQMHCTNGARRSI